MAPLAVEVEVAEGRLRDIRLLPSVVSDYGRRYAARMRAEMLRQQRADVDIVSGATQTGYAFRSAVFHACRGALERRAPVGGAGQLQLTRQWRPAQPEPAAWRPGAALPPVAQATPEQRL